MKSELMTALIVDDDEMVRKMLTFGLKLVGFNCLCSSDGADALTTLDIATFDLVVTDLLMPKTHGYELVTQLLQFDDRPLIVVHTSVSDSKLAGDLRARGVDEIVYKPTDYKAFAARMDSLVLKRRREREEKSQDMFFPSSSDSSIPRGLFY